MKKLFILVICVVAVLFASCEQDEPVTMENGHTCVDLGLSVKWATCNVGASKPEDYGDYFAWGETQSKEYYDWSTYKWSNGNHDNLTKYGMDSNYGIVDNKIILDKTDDAAAINWGGSWRIPTDAEMTELREQCTWTWTNQNGVNGYKVTSTKNSNSIFLPAAGYRYDDSLCGNGSYGYYWVNSLDTEVHPYYAFELYFDSRYVVRYFTFRYCGVSLRPVCQ